MIKILEKPEDANRIVRAPLRPWTMVIIHHTATDNIDFDNLYGDDIDHMHRQGKRKGYPRFRNGMGYHFLINPNGIIQYGDRWESQLYGAHCRTKERTWNYDAIGVAFVGNFSNGTNHPTNQQLYAWRELRPQLMPRPIFPHNVFKKTECPGNNLDLRNFFGAIIDIPEGRKTKEA
ncbi:MAG: peptidoglycan recognition protein family protein [Planctomycetota bacterium]|jgi:hypothetical protein